VKVIIYGSRDIDNIWEIEESISLSGLKIDEVVSGRAKGVDTLGEVWAKTNDVPVSLFPADWSLGRSAGIIRNIDMADYADALIAVTNGSIGTAHMIKIAKMRHMPVYVKYQEMTWIHQKWDSGQFSDFGQNHLFINLAISGWFCILGHFMRKRHVSAHFPQLFKIYSLMAGSRVGNWNIFEIWAWQNVLVAK